MIRAIAAVIGLQIAVTAVVAGLFLYFAGPVASKSALVGGAIAFIPGAFYAFRIFRSRYGSPDRMLRAHYAGEFGKLALTAVLFVATFAWVREISVVSLFAAYIATLLVYWMALLMFSKI